MSKSSTGNGEFTTVTVNTKVHTELCNIGQNLIGHAHFRKQILGCLNLFLELLLFATVFFHKGIRIFVKLTAALDNIHTFCNIKNRDDTGVKAKTVKKLWTQLTLFRITGTDKHKTCWMANTDTFSFNHILATCCNVKQNIDKMVIKQVNFINVEEATVRLCKQSRFKGFYATGKRLFDIDGTANTIFGCTKRKVNNRYRNFFCFKSGRINCFMPLFGLLTFNILIDGAIVGIALNAVNKRKHFGQCPDGCTFSGTPVTHNKHTSDSRINNIENQTELHFLLTNNCCKRKGLT